MRLLANLILSAMFCLSAQAKDAAFVKRFSDALNLTEPKAFEIAALRASKATRRFLICGSRMTKPACDEKRKQFAAVLSENKELVIKTMITLSNEVFYKAKKYKEKTGALGLVLFIEDNPKAAAGEICKPPKNADYRCTILRGTFLDPAIVKLSVEADKRARKRVQPYFKP